MKTLRQISLSTSLLTYVALSFLSIFILIFQTAYYSLPAVQNVLWYPGDLPGIGITEVPKSFGQHYFGDFLHVITASTRSLGETPYYPYMASSLTIGKLFSLFPYQLSVFAFFGLFLPVFLSPLLLLTKSLSSTERVLLLMVASFNIGTLYLIDRGNIQLVVSASISLFFLFQAKQKNLIAALCLSIGMSIKIWPIIFLLPLFLIRSYKPILIAISSAIALNFLPLLTFYASDPRRWSYTQSQISQILTFSSIDSGLWHAGGKNTSLAALIYFVGQVQSFTSFRDLLLSNYALVQYIGVFALLIGLLKNRKSLRNQFLLVSIFALIVPSAQYGYSMSILIPTLCFGIYEQVAGRKSGCGNTNIPLPYHLVILSMLPISLVLPIEQTSQWFVDLNTLLSPILLSAAFILLIIPLRPVESNS